MVRQVNNRLILKTAAMLIVAAGVAAAAGRILHGIAQDKVLPRARKLVAKAEESLVDSQEGFSEARKDYDKALELYQVHLDHYADDQEAWGEYVDVLIKAQREPLAAEAYRNILKLDPDNYDALLWLVKFETMLAKGRPGRPAPPDPSARWSNVLDLAATMTKVAPDKAEGYRYLAQAQDGLGKSDDAETTLKKLIARYPEEEQAYFHLAQIAERKGAPADAWRKYIEDCLNSNPQSWSAYLRAYKYLAARRQADAPEYLSRALEMGPEEPNVLFWAGIAEERAAREEEQKGDNGTASTHWDAARTHWEKRRSVAPSDFFSYDHLARISWMNRDGEGAIAVLREGLTHCKASGEAPLRFLLTEFLIELGRRDEAREEVGRLRGIAPRSSLTAFLEGYSLLAEGRPDETARALLERGVKGLSGLFKAHFILGKCYDVLREPGLARDAFMAALERAPNFIPARIFLARSLLQCGEPAAAAQEARKAARAAPEHPDAWSLLARALSAMQGGERPPEDVLAEAIKSAETAVEILPSADALILLADLYRKAARAEDAEATLTCEPADPKDSTKLRSALVVHYLSTDQVDRARQVYDDVVKQQGHTIWSRLKTVNLFGPASPEEREQRLLEILDEASEEEMPVVRHALVSFYQSQKKRDKAVEQLEAIAAAKPGNTAVRRLLFRLALDTGDEEQAKVMIDELAGIEGNNSPVVVCDRAEYDLREALRRNDHRQARTVVKNLESLCKKAPSSRAWAILGDAHKIAGNLTEAIRCYQSALRANPGMVRVGVALVGALNVVGREEEADAELDRLVRVAPRSGQVLQKVYERLISEKNLNGAIEVKQRQLDLGLDNVETLFTLGQLLRARGDLVRAEEHLRRAHELEPNSPSTVFALASFLKQTDREEEGLKLCDEFVAAGPSERAALVCRARYHQLCGKLKEADEDLHSALELDPKDRYTMMKLGDVAANGGNRDEAMGWYRKAAELEPPGSRARKNLAEKLIRTGSWQDVAEANEVVDAVLKEEPKDPDVHLFKSRVNMLSYETLGKARRHCRRAIELAPDSAAPRIQMSYIYQAEDNMLQATDEAGHAHRLEPESVKAVMLYADLLKRRQLYAEAGVVLDKAPRSPRVTLARAGLIAAHRGAKEAVEFIKTTIAELKEDASEQLRLQLQLTLANYLQRAGNDQEAEMQLRAALKLSKNAFPAVAALARFLDKRKRVDETDRLLDGAADDASEAAMVSLKLLRCDFLLARKRGANDRAEAERLAGEVLALRPQSTNALRILGHAAYLSGNTQQAIAHYRKAMNADFRDVFVANNLAWVLAETGHPEKALPYARNAALYNPNSPNFHDTLGDVYYRLGKYDESRRALTKCVELSSGAVASWYRLGRTLRKMKKWDDAKQALERARQEDEEAQKLTQEQKRDIAAWLKEIGESR